MSTGAGIKPLTFLHEFQTSRIKLNYVAWWTLTSPIGLSHTPPNCHELHLITLNGLIGPHALSNFIGFPLTVPKKMNSSSKSPYRTRGKSDRNRQISPLSLSESAGLR